MSRTHVIARVASAPERSQSDSARALMWTLAWLRVCAVSGQGLTVLIVAYAFGMHIPFVPLALGIGALAAFGAFAFWRLRQPWPANLYEAFVHIVIDIGVLSYLLYFSGGATNPFVSLLVMPIALAAAALPLRYVIAVALVAAACYFALIPWHVALPPSHPAGAGDFNLHVAGMAINFVVTAGLLAFFIARLAHALREREADVQYERERALRDEGILAIATQAAGTAHELNTPLSTIRTLLAELRREHPADDALGADIALLSGQAERCRDILRELVAVGSRQLSGTPRRVTIAEFVHDCEEHFRLLRPEVTLLTAIDEGAQTRVLEAAPNLRHALINLLSNAADASLAADSDAIELGIVVGRDAVEFFVRDHGTGGIAPGAGTAFRTSKGDGLGLGLALAHSTAERLGGELIAQALADGGLLQRLRVPLAAPDNALP